MRQNANVSCEAVDSVTAAVKGQFTPEAPAILHQEAHQGLKVIAYTSLPQAFD